MNDSKGDGDSRKRNNRSFKSQILATQLSEAIKRDFTNPLRDGEERHATIRASMMETTLKKFPPTEDVYKALDDKTYAKFAKVNSYLRAFPEVKYPEKGQRIQTSTSDQHKLLIRAKAVIASIVGRCWEEEFFPLCKTSGGVTQGVPFVDTSPDAKLTFPITITARCIPLFDQYLRYDHQLYRQVLEWNQTNPFTDRYDIVSGSRATTVKKDDSINRFISVEATANAYLQQGLMRLLYQKMADFGLDVRTLPDRHQMLAMISSITGRNATIDWFSASDLSLRSLIRYLFPDSWHGYMSKVSSRFSTLRGTVTKLSMFSTMGNAVTFPLETLVFYALGVATVMSRTPGNTLHSTKAEQEMISVFGDDCIVPTDIARLYVRNVESVGFIVNEEKSFMSSGSGFRESCGGDYLRGYNVRPYYMQGPTSERTSALEPWLYTILNRIIPRYQRYFGSLKYVYDRELFAEICTLFWEYDLKLKIVPPDFPEDSGLIHSQDLRRFLQCYHFPLDRVSVSNHGTVSFRHCNFVYRERYRKHEGIAYATWLRAFASAEPKASEDEADPTSRKRLMVLLNPPREPEDFGNTKRIGGYVVARGLTCHWQVPELITY